MQRPKRKPKEFSGRNTPVRALVLTTKWQNMVEILDHKGKPFRRFYKLETLSSAVDKLVREGDRFILPAVEKLAGSGQMINAVFTLVGEDEYRFVFSLKVALASRRRASLNLVVAKNMEEASRRVATEYKHLRILHEQLREEMAEPLRSGTIFLPDRYRREDHHREVEAYLTTQPAGYEPLGIHRNLQYTAGVAPPHTFTKLETEALKLKMVTLVLKAFNPVTRTGIDTGQLDPSTFQVNRGAKGLPKLRVFNCVHMQTRLTATKVIGFLLTDTWVAREMETSVAPASPSQFFEAVVNAVGAETARQWLKQYCHQAAAGKVKAPAPNYLESLKELAGG